MTILDLAFRFLSYRSASRSAMLVVATGLFFVLTAGIRASQPTSKARIAIAYSGQKVVDMHVSPDKLRVAVISREMVDGALPQRACLSVFQVADGALIRHVANVGTRCAWSCDGAALAVIKDTGVDVDIMRTRDWNVLQTVHLTYPKSVGRVEPDVWRICFDYHMDLYAAVYEDARAYSSKREFSPRVWWHLEGRWREPAESFGSCLHPVKNYSGAVVPSGLSCTVKTGPRLAINYWGCQTQILRMQYVRGGVPVVVPEYGVPVIDDVTQLADDGKMLVAFSSKDRRDAKSRGESAGNDVQSIQQVGRLRVFELLADHGELVRTKEMEPAAIGPLLLTSGANSRLIGYCTRSRVEVARIPGLECILSLPQSGRWVTSIDLASDGSLLAIANSEHKKIWVYLTGPSR